MLRVNRLYSWGIRLLVTAVVLASFASVASRTLAPGGELKVTSRLWGPAPFVSEPKPGDRLAYPERSNPGQDTFPLLDSPIYFDVEPLTGFDTIIQQVQYRNDGGLALEVGALASTIDQQFDMRPGENRLLDNLPWHRLSSGRMMLLERNHKYTSLDAFLSDPPSPKKLAVWGASPSRLPYIHSDYQPSEQSWETEVSLRGRHRLLTYVKDETLNLTFTIQDMNRQLGADPAIVTVYPLGSEQSVARAVLDDDGNAEEDQKSSGLRTVSVTAANLAEGAYQVEFTAPADIFIRRIRSAQRLLTFAERLYLGDYVGYSDTIPEAKIWIDGQRLTAMTAHEEALQELSVDGQSLSLSEPLVWSVRELPSNNSLSPIISPKRDVLLESDGTFALTTESWFNPLPLAIDWFVTADDLDVRGIDYILADYAAPLAENELKMATAEFSVDRLARTKDNKWRFLVAVPGAAESQSEFSLNSVSFTLRRPPFSWRDLPSRFMDLLKGNQAGQPLVLPNGYSFEESPE